MRISLIHSFYQSGSPSGENQAVLSQLAALEAAGHSVQLISQSTDDFNSDNRSFRAATGWKVATGYGSSPEKEISSFGPDVVHIHNLFPNWGYRWVRAINAPIVLSVHNYRPLCAAGTLYRAGAPCILCPTRSSLHGLVNRCYRDSFLATIPLAIATSQPFPNQFVPRHVARTIFLSEDQRKNFEELSGNLGPTAVVPNFVADVETVNNSDREVAGWCYIGRISEEKGVFDLVKWWPQGTPLAFYGGGPGTEKLLAMLTEDMVYRGPVPNAQVHELLMGHQGLVFSSKVAEISPLTYMESLRSGRPVVAFGANAAARDILSNGGRGGKVFNDWRQLPESLDALHNNKRARKEARKVYEEKFSSEAWLRSMEQIYTSVQDLGNHNA